MIFSPLLKIWELINQYESASLFLLIFAEEAGIPLPAPGDVFIANAGWRSSGSWADFFRVLSLVTVATVFGSSILYLAARKLGRGLIIKLRFLHVNQTKLERVGGWFQVHGGAVIIFGRLTPGLRIITSLAAGFFKIPYGVFLFYTTLATIIWVPIYFFLGRFLGNNFSAILGLLFHKYPYFSYPLIILLAVFLVKYVYQKAFFRVSSERK